ncbi:MAG: magnesium transporter, partial [Clostridia bacterium]|nr:magnesium transporter [Clostridia bacterium]
MERNNETMLDGEPTPTGIEAYEEIISADEREIDPGQLEQLLQEKKYTELRRQLEPIPAVDLAEIIGEMSSRSQPLLFRLLPKEQAAETFIELDNELQRTLIEGFNDAELAAILEELYLDDTVDIIEEMPATVVKKILRSTSREDREIINRLLRYGSDTAGAMMTTEYVRFVPDMTVGDALAHIRKVAIDKETIYTCYVTDRQRHLIGIVTAKALLLSDAEISLAEIMEENVVFARTSDDKEEVALLFDRYGFIALPVVDSELRLVGIVTVDDAIDVIREEAEEDFAKMAGITPTETPYLKTSVISVFKSRIPWLLLLMISATVSSTILSFFERNLASILVLFVPMLMDTGGNSGNQASVTLVRGLSLGEVKSADFLKVWWRELRVGLMCGISLGVVAFGKIMLVDRLIMQNDDVSLLVALVVGVTLSITIMIAKLI